ncbi:hypothetical protein NDN08_006027 [Rhodosorus marinus]|uniref:Cytochrome b5 heme-binding domain-containing protein n=1 Tax=Rhodosorus marinus TaxID=101924 RepID=A0AAV8UNH3_9RHOD|nr:hypothetical protein NDN08_006027 [Rhodosorus marinus]
MAGRAFTCAENGKLLSGVAALVLSVLIAFILEDHGPARVYSVEELARYDGGNLRGKIYLAVRGRIYDVSSGKQFYGHGMTYAHFAGTDASRAFIGNFEEPLDRVDDLSEADLEGITEWMNLYDHHEQYRYRGWLQDGLHWGFWNRIAKVECITREIHGGQLFQKSVNNLQRLNVSVENVRDTESVSFGKVDEYSSPSLSMRRGEIDSCHFVSFRLDEETRAITQFSIPVKDGSRAYAFYRDALGLQPQDDQTLCGHGSQVCLVLRNIQDHLDEFVPFVVVTIHVLDIFRAARALRKRPEKIKLYENGGDVWSIAVFDPFGIKVLLLSMADVRLSVNQLARQRKKLKK